MRLDRTLDRRRTPRHRSATRRPAGRSPKPLNTTSISSSPMSRSSSARKPRDPRRAHPHVERRARLGRDDVVAVAALHDVRRNRGPQHRGFARHRWRAAKRRRPPRPRDRRSRDRDSGARPRVSSISPSRAKYARVVSLRTTGGCHCVTAVMARARRAIGLRLERHRPVPRDAVRDQIDALRKFLRGLHADVADFAVHARRAAALREAVLGVDRVEVLVDHELDADLSACPPRRPRRGRSRRDRAPRGCASSCSIVMSPAVTLSLSSTVPRP